MRNPIIESSDLRFEQDVLQATEPVLVDFWAPWCGPCKALGPAIDALARQYAGKVRFVKINVDDNPAVASHLGVRAIPTVMVFQAGRVVERITGLVSPQALSAVLDKVLEEGGGPSLAVAG